MNHPVVSQNGRDWARVTVLSLCAGVGLIAPLSGYPITLAAGALILLAYTIFAVMSLREPLIFVVVFLLVLEVLPPFYFSQTGERSRDRKSTRLNSSHVRISYAVFCLKKKKLG